MTFSQVIQDVIARRDCLEVLEEIANAYYQIATRQSDYQSNERTRTLCVRIANTLYEIRNTERAKTE